MFSSAVTGLPTHEQLAGIYYNNVNMACDYNVRIDESFLASLRVLCSDRLKALDETLSLHIRSFDYRTFDAVNVPRLVSNAFGDYVSSTRSITISLYRYAMGGDNPGLDKMADALKRDFVDYLHSDDMGVFSYSRIDDLTAFMEQFGVRALFWYNQEFKNMLVFLVTPTTLKSFHLLQAIIPRLCPWVFDGKPCEGDELELLAACTKKTPTQYVRAIEKLVAKVDFRELAIKQIIKGFGEKQLNRRIRSAMGQMTDLEQRVDEIESRYQRAIEELSDVRVKLFGLQAMREKGDGDDELESLFRTHKVLIPVGASDNTLTFIVKNYLDVFDPDVLDIMLGNPNSFVNNSYGSGVFIDSRENRSKLLRAIFGEEPKLRVKTCAYYALDLRGRVSVTSGYNYPVDCSDRIPNPHIHHFSCLGSYSEEIQRLLRDGDMVGAIEQCIVSAASINIGESPTFSRLEETLFSETRPVLETMDGTAMTPEEALDWLNQNETEAA